MPHSVSADVPCQAEHEHGHAGLAGGAGYYYFGSSASPLVTTDLAHKAPFSGHALLLPGVTVDRIVAGCVLINAYTTYPCLILVIQVGVIESPSLTLQWDPCIYNVIDSLLRSCLCWPKGLLSPDTDQLLSLLYKICRQAFCKQQSRPQHFA